MYVAPDNWNPAEIWFSDGTSLGTGRVGDDVSVWALVDVAQPWMPVVGDRVVFWCYSPSRDETILRAVSISSGDAEDLPSYPRCGATRSADGAAPLNGGLVLTGAWPACGEEPCWTDGTSSGTRLIADTRRIDGSSDPFAFVPLVDRVVMAAGTSHGQALCSTDGTPAGTLEIGPWNPQVPFTAFGSTSLGRTAVLPVQLGTGCQDTETALWRTDGTPAGTRRIDGPAFGSKLLGDFTRVGSDVYFTSHTDTIGDFELWITDGTPVGTRMVAPIPASSASLQHFLVEYRGLLYFASEDVDHGVELWGSDGTLAGTGLVADIVPGPASSSPGFMVVSGGNLYFRDLAAGRLLWVTDGTAAGTRSISDLGGGVSLVGPSATTPLGGGLFFTAYCSATGTEPWFTDGTIAGTVELADIAPGPARAQLMSVTAAGRLVWFVTDDGSGGGWEPWRTDGTPAGTFRIGDLRPGSASSDAHAFVDARGTTFFSATDGLHGAELWRSDGTAAGTSMLEDLEPAGDSDPGGFTVFGDDVLFAATTVPTRREPWTRPLDSDWDDVADKLDNCLSVANASQSDSDGDGRGDACDACAGPDRDLDDACDAADDCVSVRNADQADVDGDGLGDACDPDADGDGLEVAQGDCDDRDARVLGVPSEIGGLLARKSGVDVHLDWDDPSVTAGPTARTDFLVGPLGPGMMDRVAPFAGASCLVFDVPGSSLNWPVAGSRWILARGRHLDANACGPGTVGDSPDAPGARLVLDNAASCP